MKMYYAFTKVYLQTKVKTQKHEFTTVLMYNFDLQVGNVDFKLKVQE